MTNEQAKQEAIKKAYGKHWEQLQDFINSEGEVCKAMCPDNLQNIFGNVFWNNLNGQWWPRSLDGVCNNNGWIRIEPDGSNLPTGYKEYLVCVYPLNGYRKAFFNNGVWDFPYRDTEGMDHRITYEDVTHYKPIKEEPKPLY